MSKAPAEQRASAPGRAEDGPQTLLFGIGNCGRGDDGLGWTFLDRVRQSSEFRGQLEYRYQLQVEDSALAAGASRVIFVDSFHGHLPGGFRWGPCEPSGRFEFTSHVLPPQAVVHLCRRLYGKSPRAALLLIQGSQWGLHNGLSPTASEHLDRALLFFRSDVLLRT
jgi:hydrogenase maturation protease